MTSSPVPASVAERSAKPRVRGHRRVLTVAGVLLALIGGVATEPGAAFAQAPAGTCTQFCNNPPAGVSVGDWNAAVETANFWSDHQIDFAAVDWSNAQSYYHLDYWQGHGWPGQTTGNQWFGYWENGVGTRFVYYGGTYNDYNGLLSNFEQNSHGATSSQAFSTGNGRTAPYVEYDMDYYTAARSSRNARRIVRNPNTGNVYATFDHYNSFYYLGRY